MAFIIISSKGNEIGRRGLVGGITVGRASDCDMSVHDILLSRHHCRIEPSGRGWVVLDLRSKNGTWLDGERVGRRSLRHGEVVRAGNTTIRFMLGTLPGGAEKPRPPKSKPRPADPFEAMAGTVVDFDPEQADEVRPGPHSRMNSRMPYPRPMPREPASYAQDGVYSLLEEIASSSWDSIYANASRPTRPRPEVVVATEGHRTQPATIARSLKRPAAPMGWRPRNAASPPVPDTLPVPSRLQVDFSLQAPAPRAPRAVRNPLSAPLPAPPARIPSRPSPGRKSIALQAWHGVAKALAVARRWIAPPGSIMLF